MASRNNYPSVNIACPGGEVHPYFEEFAGVRGEREGILPVLDLIQGLFGTAVELELHDVYVVSGLENQVYPAS